MRKLISSSAVGKPDTAIPTVPNEGSSLDAGHIIHLASRRSMWVTQRFEHLHLVDDRYIERTTDLHLDLSHPEFRELVSPTATHVVLPLAVAHSSRTAGIIAQTTSGEVLARPSDDWERHLVADGLTRNAPGFGQGDHAVLRSEIYSIIGHTNTLSDNESYSGPLASLAVKVHAFLEDLLGTASQEESSEYEQILHILAARGVDDESLRDFAMEIEHYRSSRLLLAYLPSQLAVGPATVRLSQRQMLPPLPFRSRLRRLGMGTLSVGASMTTSGACHCQTFHVTAEAPPGFRIVDMAMFVDEVSPRGESTTRWAYDDSDLESVGHVSYSRNEASNPVTGTILLNAYSTLPGFPANSAAIAVVTSALMAVFTFFLGQGDFAFDSDSPWLSEDLVSGLTLFLPAVAAGLIANQESYRIGARAYASQKLMLAIVAGSSAAAAVPIAFQVPAPLAETLWWAATGTCWAASLRILLGSALTCWRTSDSRDELWTARRRLRARRLARTTGRRS